MNTFMVNALGLALLIGGGVFDLCSSSSYSKNTQAKKTPDHQSSIVFPEAEHQPHDQYDYHHHHHHHDHYDFGYHNNENDALRPLTTTAKPTTTTEKPRHRNAFENATGIPLDFLEKLNNERWSVNDLLLHYVDDYEDSFIRSRFGEEEERRSATIPKDAKCMPELTTVKLASSDDPNVLYIPACTRIERCGGCCSHSLLSCQPTEVETVNYQVIKTRYTGGSKLKYLEKEIIPVDKHVKCACDCRVQAQDCTPMQEYHKNECKCICRNVDEEKKCYKNNETRLWDPQSCSCKCREERVCSTGTVFDWNQCKCVLVPMKRRFAEYPRTRRGYKSEAQPVIPLQYDTD